MPCTMLPQGIDLLTPCILLEWYSWCIPTKQALSNVASLPELSSFACSNVIKIRFEY